MPSKKQTKTPAKPNKEALLSVTAFEVEPSTGEIAENSAMTQLNALHVAAVAAGNAYRELEETKILLAAEQQKVDAAIAKQFPEFAALQKKANKLRMAIEDTEAGLKSTLATAAAAYYATLPEDERKPKLLGGSVQMRQTEKMLTFNPDQALDWADEMNYVHLVNRTVDKKKVEALLKAGTPVPPEVATYGKVITPAVYEQELKEYSLLFDEA